MPASPPAAAEREVFTISGLNAAARRLLESGMGVIWVTGEVSNFARPASGHWYFTLKDQAAQLRCAMWRARNQLARCALRDGMAVLARGRISLYEARGEYQLIVEHLEEAGAGALQRAFEELKARLQQEGLFDLARKRPLPTLPHRVGVITSPTGAALRDVLQVMRRRFPAVPVVVYPVPVQGAAAAPAIVAALELANARNECEVLILARGGGSLEDLWAFNDERVARAIRASRLPVIAGIGHETDFTIADFAADARAPTPSAAAAQVTPERGVWLAQLQRLLARLDAAVGRELRQADTRLAGLAHRLGLAHPGARLQQQMQRVDELDQRLGAALARLLADRELRLAALSRALDAVSPLATLTRGYAIVRRVDDGTLVQDSAQLREGDEVEARLARGAFRARVLTASG